LTADTSKDAVAVVDATADKGVHQCLHCICCQWLSYRPELPAGCRRSRIGWVQQCGRPWWADCPTQCKGQSSGRYFVQLLTCTQPIIIKLLNCRRLNIMHGSLSVERTIIICSCVVDNCLLRCTRVRYNRLNNQAKQQNRTLCWFICRCFHTSFALCWNSL